MRLAAGTHIGPYEIVAPLGSGGMGEVYRARDPKLEREVALKVLPRHLADDSFSLERFEREAKAIAALSVPNVVRIHDYGKEGEILFAVMELLEGENLRQRLASGPLPVRKAVEIARRVAEGLAAAHDKEIVHRDLKPENVFLTRDGQVKILDFGLAKVELIREVGDDLPTFAESRPGALLGTIEYMSPEQIRGQEVDTRADLFALGALLYEMLAGQRPFRRESLADEMSAILGEDAPPIEREPSLPVALEQILHRCLEKRREERFQSARDLAFALSSVAASPSSVVSQSGAARLLDSPRPRRAPWLPILSVLGLGAAFGAGWWTRSAEVPPAPPSRAATFQRLTTLPGEEKTPSIGPEGSAFVYVSEQDGDADIFLQRIGGQKPIQLTADSEVDDTAPSFSPDGQRIAFRSERSGGGIFVMGATGESVRRLTDFGFDPGWSPDGESVVVAGEGVTDPLNRTSTSPLWVVRVSDGESRLLVEGDAVQPDWSPNGQRIAYFSVPPSGERDLLTVAASGLEDPVAVTRDAATDWSPLWSADGRWLYFSSDRGGAMSLWRVRIDEGTGRPLAEPEAMTVPAAWAGDLSGTDDGTRLVYATREARSTLYRVALDPEADDPELGEAEVFLSGSLHVTDVALSADGKRVAFTTHGSREDLFVVDTDGSGFLQLTDDPERDRGPQWSPDGEWIAFYSNRSGRYELWKIRADGSGIEQLTRRTAGPGFWYPSWSPDGKTLATAHESGTTLIPLDDPEQRTTLPPIDERRVFQACSWSPDGRILGGLARRTENGAVEDGLWMYLLEEKVFSRFSEEGQHPLPVGDGSRWLAARGAGLSFFDANSGEWHDLKQARIDRLSVKRFAVSADGRIAVYIETERAGDVWLMSLE